MCKVFPSNLGSVAMKWFDGLEEGSINSFQKLTRAFGAQFVTCSRVPFPLDSLLSMAMREGETLKTYSDRYSSNRPRRDFPGHVEPLHQILDKIKNEPYFKWPNKMGGDLTKCNQGLYCQYH